MNVAAGKGYSLREAQEDHQSMKLDVTGHL